MSKGPFHAESFSATQWNTAEDKAVFGNNFLRFVDAGFLRSMFHKPFYNRLSMSFQHIAHYNVHGFYEEWFTSLGDQVRFLKHTLRSPCYGDPVFTYSDVEKAIQAELRRRNYLEAYTLRFVAEQRVAEVELLTRLERKYRQPVLSGPARSLVEALEPMPEADFEEQRVFPVQQPLF